MTRRLLAALSALLLATVVASSAYAADRVVRLTWDLSVGGTQVGTRTATITLEDRGHITLRSIDAMTELQATVGAKTYTYKQRLTSFADEGPMAFHAVMNEDGRPREVQARWAIGGWTVSLVDKTGARTMQAAPHRIDLSTVDLLDPRTRVRLGDFTTAKILSAETGDIWEGQITALGTSNVRVAGKELPVQGFSWAAPTGTSTYWYDAEGWLVQFELALGGRTVRGILRDAPPASPDAFGLDLGEGGVETQEL